MASEAEVRALLNEVVDPCSISAGMPVGLVDMGIVQEVSVEGSAVHVRLLPTFPACRFVPIFEGELRERLAAEGLSVEVALEKPDVVWDESQMAPHVRQRLEERRRRMRAALGSA